MSDVQQTPQPRKSFKKPLLIGCGSIGCLSLLVLIVIALVVGVHEEASNNSSTTVAGKTQEATESAEAVHVYWLPAGPGKGYSANSSMQPGPGNTYVAVSVRIVNKGTEEVPVNPFYCQLKVNGVSYQAMAPVILRKDLQCCDLSPSGSIDGYVAFEIPKADLSKEMSFEFEPLAWNSYDIVYHKSK